MEASGPTRSRVPNAAALLVGLAVTAGIVARLHSRSDLWLDEALTVNIAKLSVGDLLSWLKHDGHPPLYYLLLHFWMKVFGEGDDAVRSLSGVFSIATLPLIWIAGRRYGGRIAATSALILLATSPFAVRYGTEARMYSLVMLLVVAGWLLVYDALERPAIGRLAAIALVSGLLALSHYWGLYLLAATALLLLWLWRRGRDAALRIVIAITAGGVLFLPWLPSFLSQAANTGTPWGRPERPTNVLAVTFTDWGGGPNGEAQTIGILLILFLLLALFGRAIDRQRVELDLRTQPRARPEVAVNILTFFIATVIAYASGGAFASRYTAVVFPVVILLAALGLTRFMDMRVVAVALAAVAVLGLIGSSRVDRGERTQLGLLASYITQQGSPGDVIGFCPDQLGPATMRHIPAGFTGLTFPNGGDPHLVDWIDYEERQKSGSPREFAALLDQRGGDHTVWVVWAAGYRTLDRRCERSVHRLKKLRPGCAAVRASGPQFEHGWLYQCGPVPH
jgi:mannosyltransferase